MLYGGTDLSGLIHRSPESADLRSVVGGGAACGRGSPRDTDDLLALALSRPQGRTGQRAGDAGRAASPYAASVAHQAVGIVLRDFGDVEAGVRELREALRLARRSGSAEREIDVLASLGAALVYAGRTPSGLAALDQAVQRSSGVLEARVLVRRGIMLVALGRYQAALEDLRNAIGVLRRADDSLYGSCADCPRMAYLATGIASRADADFAAAGRLFAIAGQELEASLTVLNRGNGRVRVGRPPGRPDLPGRRLP